MTSIEGRGEGGVVEWWSGGVLGIIILINNYIAVTELSGSNV